MPLTPQEQRCIDLALGPLGDLYGGTWRVSDGPTLDDLHESQSSPECLVTNGSISAAVEVLPPDLKTVILLREFEGMSYAEIARVIRRPIGTVMSRLFHARQRLQQSLRMS